jgi:hypothetical protein
MTVEEAADIPQEMQIVVPLRANEQRVVSLFRFNFTQYEYVRGLRTFFSPRVTIAWNPRSRSPLGNRVTRGHEYRHAIQNWVHVGETMSNYIASDGRTLLWRRWADDALGPAPRGLFWYRELLPGLASRSDPRWGRLRRVPTGDLDAWTREEFGAKMPHANRSTRELPGVDLAAAAAELLDEAPGFVLADRATWELLLS